MLRRGPSKIGYVDFIGFLFAAAFLLHCSSVVAFASGPECERYLRGEVTSKGRSPEEFFADQHVGGRPRLVLPIGIQGSGKSTWLRTAARLGWKVISADALRVARVTEMNVRGELLELNDGTKVVPDPRNPNHVLCKVMRDYAYALMKTEVEEALRTRQSFALDSTNVFPNDRIQRIYSARERGYFIDALVFKTADYHMNMRNVRLRGETGGIDLVPSDEIDPDGSRERQIFQIKPFYDAFRVTSELENPDHFNNVGPLPMGTGFPVHYIKFTDRESFFSAIPPEAIAPFRELLTHEVYNNVEEVETQDWSARR